MKKRRALRNHFLTAQHPQVKAAVRKPWHSGLLQKLMDHPGIVAIVLALLAAYIFTVLLSAVRVAGLSSGSWAVFG